MTHGFQNARVRSATPATQFVRPAAPTPDAAAPVAAPPARPTAPVEPVSDKYRILSAVQAHQPPRLRGAEDVQEAARAMTSAGVPTKGLAGLTARQVAELTYRPDFSLQDNCTRLAEVARRLGNAAARSTRDAARAYLQGCQAALLAAVDAIETL